MGTRRHLLTATIATSLATLVGRSPTTAAAPATSPMAGLRPPRLQPGDTIGLISPAGATFLEAEIEIVLEAMRGLGLVPRLGPHARDRYGYLAGSDRDRAADVNAFFADPTVNALMPIRGDWGSARILPELDYDLIQRHPKIIVGFSDITALLLAITAQTGLITFHGPHGLTSWKPDQTALFRDLLFNGATPQWVNLIAANDRDRLMLVENRIQTITPGRAQGHLIGGNLSVLAGIVGSPYCPDPAGAILFLEDIGESIYRVDRLLTQLKLAGILDQLAGFIWGQCRNCGPGADYGSLTLEEVVRDHIQPLGIPAWSGAAIGHVEPILTLPIGAEVAIDAERGLIQLLAPAVI